MATSRKDGTSTVNNKRYRSRKYRKSDQELHIENKPFLIPILLIVTILPLIMKMYDYDVPQHSKYPWFPFQTVTDFFLYYKMWLLIIISITMVIIIAVKTLIYNEKLRFTPLFIPLAGYAFLALLSSILSEHRAISFSGGPEQFESIFVLLGYCLITYYVYLFVQTEYDIRYILFWVTIGAVIIALIGFTQYMGSDIFTTTFGRKLITPSSYHDYIDTLKFNFGKNRVYGTLYNPNYVGVYVALLLPVIVMSAFHAKKRWHIPLYIITIVGLIISLIGSKSTSGLISIVVSLIVAIVFSWRYVLKYFYLTIPLVLLLLGLFIISLKTDNYISRGVKKITDINKTEVALTDIQTLDDYVTVTYKGNTFSMDFGTTDEGYLEFDIRDEEGNKLAQGTSEVSGEFTIDDERFQGITYSPILFENQLAFSISIDGTDWMFTNNTEDGSYYFINRFGRLDKIETAKSLLFTGYERFASRRGYIWSRSIPLLFDNFFIGTGADTFVLAFPQQDYVNLNNYGYGDQIISKPHNIFLQIGVQTGTLSLILFIAFFMYYFITSIKLYIRGRFDSYYSRVGVAILISTISYMIAGLANDSSITVAPLFWVLIGLGIVVNEKAKENLTIEASDN